MKKEQQKLLLRLRKVLNILLLLVVLIYFIYILFLYSPESLCFPCHKQLDITSILLLAPLTLLVLIVISILIRSSKDTLLYGFFLVSVLFLMLISYLGVLNPPCPTSCFFPVGFSCISYKLSAGTSEFDFTLGQGTSGIINITGMKCIVAGADLPAPTYIEPLNKSISVTPGDSVKIVGRGTNNTVYCKNEDGSTPSDTSAGSLACLSIYINYTDTATGQSHIISTHPSARYEN